MKTLRHLKTPTKTPQNRPILGRETDMERMNSGGFAFKADIWTRLNRFLTIGSEGGTYYAGERDLTLQNIQAVDECLRQDGPRVVSELVAISAGGRAPKNDQAILVLARALKYQGKGAEDHNALATRRAAEGAVNKVCRIGTHIFQLAEAIEAFGGWGRLTTRAIAGWYGAKNPDQIAFQAVKYQQREGWSHRDLIKLAHVVRNGEDKSLLSARARVYGWILDHDRYADYGEELPRIIEGFTRAQAETDKKEVARLIRDYGLQREMIPTQFLNDLVVWEALLEKMPMTAMIRNLGKMSQIGLLDPVSDGELYVVNQLRDEMQLHKSRIHPINVLIAMKTYGQGHGIRGSLTWNTSQRVMDALDDAFYGSFHNLDTITKRTLVAIDKSGSMQSAASATILTAVEAAAVMAMATVRKSDLYFVVGYDTGLVELDISPKMRLDQVVRSIPHVGGGTDCSVPIRWAQARKIMFDAITLYSDGESWAGHTHSVEALNSYRRATGLNTLFITCDTISNRTQLGDNLDRLSFHCAGFDESAPSLIQNFIASN